MKNWKNNRGILINKKKDENKSMNVNELYNYNTDKYLLQEINVKRVVDLEFSKINYIDNLGIKKYFKWKKM